MFIRPVGARVEPARRPSGRPLLRGLLTRAAGPPPPSPWRDGAPEPGAEPAEPGAEPSPVASAEPGAEPGAEPEAEPAAEPGAGAGPGAVAGPGPVAGGPATGPGAPPGGLAGELAELAKLAREGLLTPQEFKEAKARLLHP
ncbi:SHOCT domain-containing protein [Streptomyces sp. NPDC002209]|uniref:SHOCT domain-containing protein n=1 Tax=Streptomyces sp. NPDC002209 TaxID=3364638 RepID=UPI00369B13B5